jgi:hypothetical protein
MRRSAIWHGAGGCLELTQSNTYLNGQ